MPRKPQAGGIPYSRASKKSSSSIMPSIVTGGSQAHLVFKRARCSAGHRVRQSRSQVRSRKQSAERSARFGLVGSTFESGETNSGCPTKKHGWSIVFVLFFYTTIDQSPLARGRIIFDAKLISLRAQHSDRHFPVQINTGFLQIQ